MIRKVFSMKRIVLYVIIILVTFFCTEMFYAPYKNAANAVAYYYGNRGDVIAKIQTNLKKWGYYTGAVDGIYGYNTYVAIKKFQSINGLTVDGIVGNATLAALGINVTATGVTSSYSNNSDLNLLARLINGEARGEPYAGQVAVGAVIMNRTRDSRFPGTIAGVIYQPGAFTAIVDGQINAQLETSSINAARDALNGWDPSGGAVFYYNPAKTTNAFMLGRPVIKVIGNHVFCK